MTDSPYRPSSPETDFDPSEIDAFFSPETPTILASDILGEPVATGIVQKILDEARETSATNLLNSFTIKDTEDNEFASETGGLVMSPTDLAKSENDGSLKQDRQHESLLSESGSEIPKDVDFGWQQKSLHIFVLSEAGKPIYARYGDEGQLSSIMGVMQALVSFVAASKSVTGDQLRVITGNDRKFVFVCRPHLILVAIGHIKETEEYLQLCLEYVYQQLLSLLTLHRLEQRFSRQKNLDLRCLLGSDVWLITAMIDFVHHQSFGAFLNAFACLPLSAVLRDAVTSSISQSVKLPDLVFALLLANNHVVSLVRMKGHHLQPSDLHLIINLVTNSQSLKFAQANWLPICLPKFDANGFLYANVTYLSGNICLVLLSVDNSQFYTLQSARDTIEKRLKTLNHGKCLEVIATTKLPSVSDLEISPLRHFVYKHIPSAQYIASQWTSHYASAEAGEAGSPGTRAHEVMTAYRRMHARLHAKAPSEFERASLVYQASSTDVYFASKTEVFELYATFDPFTTKSTVVEIRKSILKWIAAKKHSLFLSTVPVF